MPAPNSNRRVIGGPAGHWYAISDDPQFGETLIGLPMLADESPDSPAPPHPADTGDFDGWYAITDPAPGCDDAEIIAQIKEDAEVERLADAIEDRIAAPPPSPLGNISETAEILGGER